MQERVGARIAEVLSLNMQEGSEASDEYRLAAGGGTDLGADGTAECAETDAADE